MIPVTAAVIAALLNTAAFEFRELSASPLFPGAHSIVENENPSGISLPAVFPVYRGGFISGAGSNPYGIDGLISAFGRSGYANGRAAFVFSWYRFGIEEYMENTASLISGFRAGDHILLGASLNRYSQEIKTDQLRDETVFYDWELSAAIKTGTWIDLYVWQSNIKALSEPEREDLFFPETGGGVRFNPVQGLSFALKGRRTRYGGEYYAAASINLLKNFTLKAGYYPELLTGAAAFSLMYGNLSIDYCMRFHPHLGGTHNFGLTASTEKIRVSPLVYRNRFSGISGISRSGTLDINSCSEDEIRSIVVLEKVHAERIIKYRNIFGEITENSLRQIGMSREDIKRLSVYIEPVKEKEEFKKPAARESRAEARRRKMKELFDALIAEGVSPLMSMDYTRAAFSADSEALDRVLDSDGTLSPDKKRRIRELCLSSL